MGEAVLHHIGSTRNKTGRSILYAAFVAAVATLAVSSSEAGPAKADFGTSEDPIVVSPLTWNPTYMPITPFKATDGLYHLQYQLLVIDVLRATHFMAIRSRTKASSPTGNRSYPRPTASW
jgi:hypothetical protein